MMELKVITKGQNNKSSRSLADYKATKCFNFERLLYQKKKGGNNL